ncbi:winged helix-turn-helix domain-containing protein [Candidatus Woesearchaeota archaeon]|nr:winged helix-turn-helix domain-containing protein [Candidatus Woesearchaeota archaeon]
METDQVFKKLKEEFRLKNKHILILKALQFKDLSAESLSKKTKIPLGRIYSYLNELADSGLIKRTNKRPFVYIASDLERNIINFMKKRIDNLVKSEAEVIGLMKETGSEQIDIISNQEKFTFAHIRLLSEAKKSIKITAIHGSFPFLLYPSNKNDFVKLREMIMSKRQTISFTDYGTSFLVYKSYKDAYEGGKQFNLLFEKSTFEEHIKLIKKFLGEEFLQKMITDLIERIKKYKMNIYIIDEYNPMEIDVTEKKVGISIRHMGVTTGILIRSSNAVKLYSAFFEQRLSRAEPILPYLEKIVS